MESLLRLAIARAGLPEPEVNAVILDESGSFVAFGDLVYRTHGVVVEYDGDHHRTDADQYTKDVDRLWRIERLGWRVLRLNSTHMRNNAAEATRRIRLTLASPYESSRIAVPFGDGTAIRAN
ncbi:DUF559 domain-containing protein [Leifsonia poae]|uniref:DUF559 domain-containing protein n=1 Tax=Leifsonia poae TaxID=110933 RepID=UPI001CBD839E|nr:DUF559 domain-containing protein [Leifsonia poae]